MFKIYKDVILWTVVLLWLLTNVIVFMLADASAVSISNLAYIIFIAVLIITKNKSKNFNYWLNTKL